MAQTLTQVAKRHNIDIREFNTAEALMARVALALGGACFVCGEPGQGMGLYLSKHPRLSRKAVLYLLCAHGATGGHHAETTAYLDGLEASALAALTAESTLRGSGEW